ncbi:MAG: prepilin peptidase [Lachnospiraceae bacterium]|nr:prepilin peptidase [Lachnospiraceae bacterium]
MNVMEGMVLAGLFLLALVDIKEKMIPVIPVMAAGGLLMVYQLWQGKGIWEVLAGLLPGLLLLLLSFCTRGGIGSGDGGVLCVLGTACGVQETVAVLGLAFVLEAVIAAGLLVMRRAGRKTELPFLPCVLAGYIVVLLR